ncbi:hypothetical protein QBC41DRAFT_320933, partial [Cercophora samala]
MDVVVLRWGCVFSVPFGWLLRKIQLVVAGCVCVCKVLLLAYLKERASKASVGFFLFSHPRLRTLIKLVMSFICQSNLLCCSDS